MLLHCTCILYTADSGHKIDFRLLVLEIIHLATESMHFHPLLHLQHWQTIPFTVYYQGFYLYMMPKYTFFLHFTQYSIISKLWTVNPGVDNVPKMEQKNHQWGHEWVKICLDKYFPIILSDSWLCWVNFFM